MALDYCKVVEGPISLRCVARQNNAPVLRWERGERRKKTDEIRQKTDIKQKPEDREDSRQS